MSASAIVEQDPQKLHYFQTLLNSEKYLIAIRPEDLFEVRATYNYCKIFFLKRFEGT
jgi:hypothetical protein